MSADTIDDLHAAEDAIDQIIAILDGTATGMKLGGWATRPENQVRNALEFARSYCRPSCGWREDDDCVTGEEYCGCPCGHGQETQD